MREKILILLALAILPMLLPWYISIHSVVKENSPILYNNTGIFELFEHKESISTWKSNTSNVTATTDTWVFADYFNYTLERLAIHAFICSNYTFENPTYTSIVDPDLVETFIARQYFTMTKPMIVKNVSLYLSFSAWKTIRVWVYIKEPKPDGSIVTISESYLDLGSASGWVNFQLSGAENITLTREKLYIIELKLPRQFFKPVYANCWKVAAYENETLNLGKSVYLVSGSEMPISLDDTGDFLFALSGYKVLEPTEVSHYALVDSQNITLTFDKRHGYYSHLINFSREHEKSNITISLFVDRYVELMGLSLTAEYYYLRPLNVSVTLSTDKIVWRGTFWTDSEKYFVIPVDMNAYFEGNQSENIAEIKYYSYLFLEYVQIVGVFSPYGELPAGYYNITGETPNYCKDAKILVKRDNNLFETTQVYPDDNVFISINVPKGNLSIDIFKDGTKIQKINKSITNEGEQSIELKTFEIGNYEVFIIWNNETAFGYAEIKFSVVEKITIIYQYLSYIGIGTIIGVPLALIARKKIREYNWEKKIYALYIMRSDGIYIWHYVFQPLKELTDPTYFSGFISAINMFIAETMGAKKKLNVIDHEENKIILAYGENIIGALIAKTYLKIMLKHLEKFVKVFEEYYGKILTEWSGDIGVFSDADKLIVEVFPRKAIRRVEKIQKEIEDIKTRFIALKDSEARLEKEFKEGKISESEYKKRLERIERYLQSLLTRLKELEQM